MDRYDLVNAKVNVENIDEVTKKVERLIEALKEANSLIKELASVESVKLDIEV